MVLSEEEIKLLKSIGYEKSSILEEDVENVENIVSRHLMKHGFDKQYNINPVGKVCESILNKLGDDF